MENKLKTKPRIANKNAARKKICYCRICNKIFDQERIYLMHNREVHRTNKYPCQECKSSFRRHDHLVRHMREKHTTTERFPCALCSSDFTRRDHLVRHMKSRHNLIWLPDTTEKPQTQISSHLNFDEEISKEECEFCDASYSRRDHLQRHVKSVHMNLTVKCPICPLEYKRRDQLTRHMKLKHHVVT